MARTIPNKPTPPISPKQIMAAMTAPTKPITGKSTTTPLTKRLSSTNPKGTR